MTTFLASLGALALGFFLGFLAARPRVGVKWPGGLEVRAVTVKDALTLMDKVTAMQTAAVQTNVLVNGILDKDAAVKVISAMDKAVKLGRPQ